MSVQTDQHDSWHNQQHGLHCTVVSDSVVLTNTIPRSGLCCATIYMPYTSGTFAMSPQEHPLPRPEEAGTMRPRGDGGLGRSHNSHTRTVRTVMHTATATRNQPLETSKVLCKPSRSLVYPSWWVHLNRPSKRELHQPRMCNMQRCGVHCRAPMLSGYHASTSAAGKAVTLVILNKRFVAGGVAPPRRTPYMLLVACPRLPDLSHRWST